MTLKAESKIKQLQKLHLELQKIGYIFDFVNDTVCLVDWKKRDKELAQFERNYKSRGLSYANDNCDVESYVVLSF